LRVSHEMPTELKIYLPRRPGLVARPQPALVVQKRFVRAQCICYNK
jgi:hypothetical protein